MSGEWSTYGGGAETPSSSDFTCNLQWGRRIVNLGIYVYFLGTCRVSMWMVAASHLGFSITLRELPISSRKRQVGEVGEVSHHLAEQPLTVAPTSVELSVCSKNRIKCPKGNHLPQT